MSSRDQQSISADSTSSSSPDSVTDTFQKQQQHQQAGQSQTHNNASQKIKKTRYRVPTVCSVCRRRKMKCDKAKPFCTSCVKNSTSHLCIYEEQPWANNNEVQKLKDQIYSLQQQNNELKNLLAQKTDTQANESSTDASYNLIIPGQPANDPVLELTKDFDLLMMKEAKMSHYGSTSYMAIVSNDPILREMFRSYFKAQTWGINFNKYFLYDQGIAPMAEGSCSVMAPENVASIFDNLTGDTNVDNLVAKINEILPHIDVLHALIDHFFSEAYAFVPFIDENAFRKNMEALVTAGTDGKATLVVGSIAILVSVSVLLCVLRFSFLSLPIKLGHGDNNHSPAVKKIFNSNVTIGPIYVEFAKACIANASALRKPTLKHIQALLVLRMYRFYAPEDGDESTDSTIFLALIVQMAKMHGLHRDPSKFSVITDHATANVWRKIWAQLMFLDSSQAFQFGCPLLIDDEYDTMLPVPTSNDSPLEKACIEQIKKQHELTLLQRDVMKCCSKIKDQPKRSELEKHLRSVEYAIQRYRSFDQLSERSPRDSFLTKLNKVHDIGTKVGLFTLYSGTYYIMMLTCGAEEIALCQRYTTKAAEGTFILFKLIHSYAKDPYIFGTTTSNFEVFLSAKLFESCKRIGQATAAFALRDLSSLFNLSKIVDNFEMTDSVGLKDWLAPEVEGLSIGDHTVIRTEELIQACERLSNRYFTCWRLVHVNSLFLNYLDSQYPGKLEDLHARIIKHNESPGNIKVGLDLAGVHQSVQNQENANAQSNEFWNSLVDTSSQSNFDYLSANLNRFDNIADPYMNERDLTGASSFFTFQDFNTFVSNDESSSLFDLPIPPDFRKASSSTEDISPKTDSSGDQVLQDNINNLGFSIDPKFGELTETDIALQVARSMFGGSSTSDFYNTGN